jgi:LmbE family N-acetylglucosaminyl deacetylase
VDSWGYGVVSNSRVILVVVAHPDDEVLGCGGTIAKLSARRETHIAILGEGITSRYPTRPEASAAELERLKADSRAVGALLGARSVTFEDLPDNRFDDVPLLDIIKRVERIIDRFKPAIVYTHHPGDLNIDHVITFRAVITAARPMVGGAPSRRSPR